MKKLSTRNYWHQINKQIGFTLIELLAVIIIIGILSILVVPNILKVYQKAQIESFKTNVKVIAKSIDTYMFKNELSAFPSEGIYVSELDIINKEDYMGKYIKNENGNIEAINVSNGVYCASGEIDKLSVEKGCENLDITAPLNLTLISSSQTFNSVTIEGDAFDGESGIAKYEFKIDDENYIDNGKNKIYTFSDLTGIEHTVYMRITNGKGLTSETNIIVNLSAPTYSVTPSGLAPSKTVTITYPERQEGYVYSYSTDEGNNWIEVPTGTTVDVVFITNGTLIARIYDGTNYITASTLTISQIISSKIYGIEFNLTTGVYTRTDDAIGMNYTVNTSTIDSDFDNADIYKEMTEETDSYGNIFIKIPKFYIKKTVNTDNTIWKYQISKSKQDNEYYLPACFLDEDTGIEYPYILVGKYNASLSDDGTKLESKTNKISLVSKSIKNFRTYAIANGSGYQLLDVHIVDVLQTLFYIEYATLDSQSVMKGNTNYSAIANSGLTDSVSTASGSQTSNIGGYPMKYRGIENLYGNVWQFVDGINIRSRVAYVARNAKNYASDTFAGAYIKVGYTNKNADGYVITMGYDINNPFIQLPITVGTVGSSKYNDYYYQNLGDIIAMFGGAVDSGTYSGISLWRFVLLSTNYATSVGSRLIKTP